VSDSDDDAKPEAPVSDGNGKLERDFEDAHRPLEPWERYRALNDAFDLEQELIDLGDHKARFALVILTGLNAVAFLMVARTDFLATMPQALRPFLGLYVFLYGAAAVYFFFQAIESLKPRIYMGDADKDLLGLRFFAGILKRDEEEYRQTWSSVRVDQLSDEIAEQVHTLSRINSDKYRALYRLYLGLQILTVLTGGLIAIFEFGHLL
jgi:hypothetical protein